MSPNPISEEREREKKTSCSSIGVEPLLPGTQNPKGSSIDRGKAQTNGPYARHPPPPGDPCDPPLRSRHARKLFKYSPRATSYIQFTQNSSVPSVRSGISAWALCYPSNHPLSPLGNIERKRSRSRAPAVEYRRTPRPQDGSQGRRARVQSIVIVYSTFVFFSRRNLSDFALRLRETKASTHRNSLRVFQYTTLSPVHFISPDDDCDVPICALLTRQRAHRTSQERFKNEMEAKDRAVGAPSAVK